MPLARILLVRIPILCLLLLMPVLHGCGEENAQKFYKKNAEETRKLSGRLSGLFSDDPVWDSFPQDESKDKDERINAIYKLQLYECYSRRDGEVLDMHFFFVRELARQLRNGITPVPAFYQAVRDYIRDLAIPEIKALIDTLPALGEFYGEGSRRTLQERRVLLEGYLTLAHKILERLETDLEQSKQQVSPAEKPVAVDLDQLFAPSHYLDWAKKRFANIVDHYFYGQVDTDIALPAYTSEFLLAQCAFVEDSGKQLQSMLAELEKNADSPLLAERYAVLGRYAAAFTRKHVFQLEHALLQFRLIRQYAATGPSDPETFYFPFWQLVKRRVGAFSLYPLFILFPLHMAEGNEPPQVPLPEAVLKVLSTIYTNVTNHQAMADALFERLGKSVPPEGRFRDLEISVFDLVGAEDGSPALRFLKWVAALFE